MPHYRFSRAVRRVTMIAALAATLAACADNQPPTLEELFAGKTLPSMPATAGTATAGDAGACTTVDAQMVDIPSAADEPRMRIAQPSGWTRFTKLDSEIIRFTLANPNLIANKFAPNIVITVEDAPDVAPQPLYEQARRNLVNMTGATDLVAEPAQVCGLPAEKVLYRGAAAGPGSSDRTLTTLYVATKINNHTYLVSATVQTTDPDNSTYQRDAQALIDGFQVLPPTPSNQ